MPDPSQPVCRRPGCPHDAVGPHRLCHGHDLHYARWRRWRDQLDKADLADVQRVAGAGLAEPVAAALDELHRHLTPGPWDWEHPP